LAQLFEKESPQLGGSFFVAAQSGRLFKTSFAYVLELMSKRVMLSIKEIQ
jgi:hypothetical protein